MVVSKREREKKRNQHQHFNTAHVRSDTKVTTATGRCQTLFTAAPCDLRDVGLFQVLIVCAGEVKRWIHAVASVWTDVSMRHTLCRRTSGEIITAPGSAE